MFGFGFYLMMFSFWITILGLLLLFLFCSLGCFEGFCVIVCGFYRKGVVR